MNKLAKDVRNAAKIKLAGILDHIYDNLPAYGAGLGSSILGLIAAKYMLDNDPPAHDYGHADDNRRGTLFESVVTEWDPTAGMSNSIGARPIKQASLGRYLPAVGGGILGGLGGVAITNDYDSTITSVLKPLLGAALGGAIGYRMNGAPPIPPKYTVMGPDEYVPIFDLKNAKYDPLSDLAEAMSTPGQKAIGYDGPGISSIDDDPLMAAMKRAADTDDFSELMRMADEHAAGKVQPSNDQILSAFRSALDKGDFTEVDRITNEVLNRGK